MIFLRIKSEYQKFYNGYTKSFEGRYCEEYRSNDCFPP